MVIEWHVVGMFAPGFFTGSLIRRFGVLNVILAGIALVVLCAPSRSTASPSCISCVALALLGVGWNFMYTGGTTLLTEAYAPPRRRACQGANDFIVFATMGLSSLASGAMVSTAGWEAMNRAVLPVLATIAAAVLWYAWRRRALGTARAT
jgi:MFS family permease